MHPDASWTLEAGSTATRSEGMGTPTKLASLNKRMLGDTVRIVS
jgi:hypothetical protein